MHSRGSSPRGEVKTIRRTRVDSEAIRPICSLRQDDRLPVLRAVGGAVESSIAGIADAAIFRPARHDHIEHTVRAARQPPRKWLSLSNPLVLQTPGAPAIRTLVNPPAKTGHVQHTRIHRTGGVKQNVGCRGLLHSGVRLRPGAAAIVAAADSAFV